MLTLVFTPSLLAIRIWFFTYVAWTGRFLARVGAGKSGKSAQDWALRRAAKRQKNTEIIWGDGFLTQNLFEKNEMETAFKVNAKTHAAE
jgi:multidrug efflux pump